MKKATCVSIKVRMLMYMLLYQEVFLVFILKVPTVAHAYVCTDTFYNRDVTVLNVHSNGNLVII